MIKSLSLLTRKDGLTHEQFTHHWVEIHAPLAHQVPGLRRYVQSHIVEERTRPDIPVSVLEIDGIADSGTTIGKPWCAPTPRPKRRPFTPTAPSSSGASRPSPSRKGSSSLRNAGPGSASEAARDGQAQRARWGATPGTVI